MANRMRNLRLKLAVLTALRASPDPSALGMLARASNRQIRGLLRWLDQSGLSLYLLWRVRESGGCRHLPARFRAELNRRLAANQTRTESMLSDFEQISDSFHKRDIPHAFLKGFTLFPAFSPAPELRHQSDIDILVPAQAIEQTKPAFGECGYSIAKTKPNGELHFSGPLRRIPSTSDDIYRMDYDRKAEIHTSMWEDSNQVSLTIAPDWLDRTCVRNLRGIRFVSLSEPDACMLQILHAFRHFLASWVRLSWLWEIDYFLRSRPNGDPLWAAVRELGGDDPILRNGAGLILALTNRLFGSPIPEILRNWCVDALSDRINCWIATFGTPWALSEFPGTKVTLFIHNDFLREHSAWRAYVLNRIIPLRQRPTLCDLDSLDRAMRARFTAGWTMYAAKRVAFHTRNFVSLSMDGLRWKHALAKAQAARAREAGDFACP
jgi:Uncharacterised nucleotidyltransferase